MNDPDAIFKDYFAVETPRTMPPLPMNSLAVTARSPSRKLLAVASIAAMLILGVWLANRSATPTTTPGPTTNFLKTAEADGGKLFPKSTAP
jgi:hypothetical protein